MEPVEATQIRLVLDRMAREKEIAAAFFCRVADRLDDVDRRRWFRRMGQDEKDQRKILLKHSRELCPERPADAPPVEVSAVHEALEAIARDGNVEYLELLRIAVSGAEEERRFCDQASALVRDRSCRIFLKILVEESVSHRNELLVELRRMERELAQDVGELAA